MSKTKPKGPKVEKYSKSASPATLPKAPDEAKKDQAPAVTGKPQSALRFTRDDSKTEHQQMAEVGISPTISGAVTAKTWAEKCYGDIGINESIQVLEARVRAVVTNDLDFAKGMLISQASALDSIFNEIARRASTCLIGQNTNITSLDGLMRVAFKAQGQCRATLQTLGELVNPRSVVFAKQANMTSGPQQVNNGATGAPALAPVPAQEFGKSANELLGAKDGARLDTGAQGAAIGASSGLEALDAINRAKVGARQGEGRGE
ncbi:MAG: hypothetical protein H0X13_16320 [Ramlibacter sp.]|nr:hypothetical protein [Ramlibacter sp.]